ncbi:MAG: hypothetical protein LBP33_09105 [Candidatus Adiutrix sp.]|jgi:hypothetical protein|nr:hypothetical protein [Candidatus Adiutrix sp.]
MWLVLLAHGSAEAELFWGDVLSSLINAAKMVFGLFMAGGLCGYWFGLPLVAVIPTFDSEVAILCGAAFIGYYACFMSSAGLIMDIFFNRGKQREKGVIKLRLFPW